MNDQLLDSDHHSRKGSRTYSIDTLPPALRIREEDINSSTEEINLIMPDRQESKMELLTPGFEGDEEGI